MSTSDLVEADQFLFETAHVLYLLTDLREYRSIFEFSRTIPSQAAQMGTSFGAENEGQNHGPPKLKGFKMINIRFCRRISGNFSLPSSRSLYVSCRVSFKNVRAVGSTSKLQ
jgi:hypothetical protein